ncbi:MAG: RHS repeat-associated core domain-containing protein [Myxococcota bacterium]
MPVERAGCLRRKAEWKAEGRLGAWIALCSAIFVAFFGSGVPAALAMEGPGGGEEDPFAAFQGDASTSLFTGAAAVTVPIRLPPGRKQATPELALRYSSHAGLSFVGLGWSLPLGVLARVTERGTPSCLAPDPEAFRLTLSASSNDLVRAGADRFLLELDEGYAEAIPDRLANTWTVRTREGMTYTFGATAEARVFAGADRFHDPVGCAFTTAWHVTRLEDPNGNTIELAWAKAGSSPIPAELLYGGNAEAGIPHPFRVRFESEDLAALGRPILRRLASGVDQTLEQRLRHIVVEARESGSADFGEIHRYSLEYDDGLDTADFLLAAVEATDLPRRSFHYSTPNPVIVDDFSEPVPDAHSLGTSRDFGSTLALMELNGDGLLDRLCVSGTGRWHAAYGATGAVQFSGYTSCSGAGNWHVPSIPGVDLNRISKVVDGRDVYLTLDLDGDGLLDLVHRPDASGSIHVYRGGCTSGRDCGFADQYEVWNNPHPGSDRSLRRTTAGNRGRQTLRDLVDLTGDGRPDLVQARANGDWDVYRNLGTGFETTALVLPAIDDLITYSPNNGESAAAERQLIDVNDDGLVDRVRGAEHRDPLENNDRMPELYFGVGPAGEITGPFAFGSGVYLCPPSGSSAWAPLCTGANALPAGWAIVGAATVQLSTGSGFSEPIPSPAPFWDDAHETSNRLRASWTASSSRETRTYRDFVDVNGDGRVDWVSSGRPWEGGDDWYVLYNQGDGRFGGGLEVLEPASATPGGAHLGRVRPLSRIADVDESLGRSFQHTQPDDRSDRQMMVLDVDGDGLAEHVRAFGLAGGDRWALRRLRFEDEDGLQTRPLLLTRVEDGTGGVTHYRHAPSTRFVPPPEVAPRLPFVSWLVTGIRRTDGLCDLPPSDWFSLAGNPCLAAGHEIVQRFEYADGLYDGLAREFRGFGRTRVFEGPAETGSLREIVFEQSPALRGKVASESLFAGGTDLLSRSSYDWRTVPDGVRTQVYLQEQRVEEHALYADFGDGASQCVVHRNSIFRPDGAADPQTRIQTTCSMACAGAGESDALCDPEPPGKKQIDTTWAEPVAGAARPVWDRPAAIVTRHVDANGALQTTAEVYDVYDGLVHGLVDRGRLTTEAARVDTGSGAFALKLFGYDGGAPSGPGNITSIHVPVTGEARVPTRIEFDEAFALHPVREIASVSNAGASAERRVESRYDLRHGLRTESVGLHGRGAGDVAGAVYDGLGRPVCEYAPGTVCGAASGFGASVEYRYAFGVAGATDPLERLSTVEVRRREPNAPRGFIVTRSYWDALGRERLATQEQNAATSAEPGSRAVLQDVVLRHVEYGPNGKPVRAYEPHAAPPSGLALDPPGGVAAVETSYVLNGNAAGLLDPAGRVFETIRFDGSRSRTYYLGRARRRIDPDAGAPGGRQTVEYFDEHGRVVLRRSLEGAAVERARWNAQYDGRDAVVAEWFGGSEATRIERTYDLLGRAVATDDPDAGHWTVRYDEAGNEIFRDDPKPGQSIQSCHDGLNRVVLQCVRASDAPDPALCASAAPACTMAYRYRYDEATPILGTPNRGLGRLTTIEGPDSRHRRAYDVRGRIVVQIDEIQGVSGVRRWDWRADLDRLEQTTYPDGEIVRHGYDVAGQPSWLAQVDAAGNWLAYYVREVLYDLRGRPLAIEHGNTTVDAFEYHGPAENHALARISSRSRSATVLDPRVVYSDLDYRDYDADGRLVRIEDARDRSGALSMSAVYAYDAVGRLTSVAGARPETFAYDEIGNLRAIDGIAFGQSTGGAAPLGPHQLDRFGDPSGLHTTLAFDENGRRTARRRSDGSDDQYYAYDAFGALRAHVVRGEVALLGYDHEGRRVVETRAGQTRRFFGRHAEQIGDTLVKSYFLGDRLVAMRTSGPAEAGAAAGPPAGEGIARGAVSPPVRMAVLAFGGLLLIVPLGRSRRTLGLCIARSGALGSSLLVVALVLPVVPLAGCAEQAGIRHYHLDHLGSPIAITGAGGVLERQYRYSAYGKVRRFDGAGEPAAADSTSRREFTGHATDPGSGLQYAGSRYYDPELASFLTPDPADQHANPYAYVGWDPINAVDPNGAEIAFVAAILLALSAALIVAGAIVAGVQSSSASIGFQTLGIGVAALAAGYVVGLAAPAAATAGWISQTSAAAINTSISVAGAGASVYGLASAQDLSGTILAGAGLALSLAGAAYSIGSLARPSPAGSPGADAAPPASGDSASEAGGVVRTAMSPRTAQRYALEAQRRMLELAQQTALAKVHAAIRDIRAQYLGREGIDVFAEVLIEGPRLPHPTRVFGQHLLPNRVEVTPVVVPAGRGPTPTLLPAVPWDRFRFHEFVPVLRDGVPVEAR